MSTDPSAKPLAANEIIKINSNHLRGNIAADLADTSTGNISEESNQLSKFHGLYMQDDRDKRNILKKEGKEKAFAFGHKEMIRHILEFKKTCSPEDARMAMHLVWKTRRETRTIHAENQILDWLKEGKFPRHAEKWKKGHDTLEGVSDKSKWSPIIATYVTTKLADPSPSHYGLL